MCGDGTCTTSNLHLLHNPFHRNFEMAVPLSEAISLGEQQGARADTTGAMAQAIAAHDTFSLNRISHL